MSQSNPKLYIWTRVGRVGGVVSSAERLATAWQYSTGRPATIVPIHSASHVVRNLNVKGVSLFWASSVGAGIKQAVVARRVKTDNRLFVHAGTEDGLRAIQRYPRLVKLALSCYSNVYANNQLISDALDEMGIKNAVASCYSPLGEALSFDHSDLPKMGRPYRVLIAEYLAGHDRSLYGVPLALDAVRLLRSRGYDVHITVLRYGGEIASDPLVEGPWIEVRSHVAPDRMGQLLANHSALLRPTTTDGDSMIVREALSLGIRVIASEVVPRPAGVELCDLAPDKIADALLFGAPVSSGKGLGRPVIDHLLASWPVEIA